MHVDLVVAGLILVLGCAAFFFSIAYVIFQLFAAVGRGFLGLFRSPPPRERGSAGLREASRVCPRVTCGKIERRPARFCSQCGAPLVPPGRNG